MSETPRVRLKSLMDGLELPKGFKLTPAREDALRAVGMLLVKNGPLECYGTTVSFRRIQGSYGVSPSASAQAAMRGMYRAGWVKAELAKPLPIGLSYSPRWHRHRVVFQDGLEQLAMRLGARRMLWDERKTAPIEAAQESRRVLQDKLNEARRILNTASYTLAVGDNDVLETYRKLRALTAEVTEAERRVEEAKAITNSIPEPTEDEAFAWLMERRLRGTKD